MKKLVFKKTYHGFEDAYDISRDVAECLDPDFNEEAKEFSGEFQGDLTVTIEYEEDES
jgi:hypothetical protein